jgi:hypothetical protein
MNREFVPYNIAVRLKELGFNDECFGWYSTKGDFYLSLNANKSIELNTLTKRGSFANAILVPTYSQAFRFFREKHYLISSIYQLGVSVKSGLSSFEYMIDKLNNLGLSQFIEDFPYNTYEEAELACLENLIELVESKSE